MFIAFKGKKTDTGWGVPNLISERKGDNGMDILKYNVGLPTSDSPDLAEKVLLIDETDVDGNVLDQKEVALELDANTAEFEVFQDSEVTLKLKVVDDGGNAAESEALTFTALDTLPPTLSGGFTALELVSERSAEPPVVEEPPAEEPPAEEA